MIFYNYKIITENTMTGKRYIKSAGMIPRLTGRNRHGLRAVLRNRIFSGFSPEYAS